MAAATPDFTIRAAETPAAKQAVLDLHAAIFNGRVAGPAPAPDLTKAYWWLARDPANTPVGFAGLRLSRGSMDRGYLCLCGVVPAARGNGLQRRFLSVRERAARQRGWVELVTDTRDNPHSANNLIAAGYEIYVPRHPWSFKDATYWRKSL